MSIIKVQEKRITETAWARHVVKCEADCKLGLVSTAYPREYGQSRWLTTPMSYTLSLAGFPE
jgi:hypothetical protein